MRYKARRPAVPCPSQSSEVINNASDSALPVFADVKNSAPPCRPSRLLLGFSTRYHRTICRLLVQSIPARKWINATLPPFLSRKAFVEQC
jgi:hypothetical protein